MMCLQNFGSTCRYQGHPQVKLVINPTPELGQFLPEEGKIQRCDMLAYFRKVYKLHQNVENCKEIINILKKEGV